MTTNMYLELEKGIRAIFSKKIETNYHSSFSYVFYIILLLLTFKEQL
jgi:hypothetical protein